jgi:hypothetical protein
MDVLLLLAILVCPIVMGGSMIWMMRWMRSTHSDRSTKADSDTDTGSAS